MILDLFFKAQEAEEAAAEHGVLGMNEQSDREELPSLVVTRHGLGWLSWKKAQILPEPGGLQVRRG